MSLIYKICPASFWKEAESAKVFRGAPVDLADGFIHFSTREQVQETAAKHFAGQDDLLLVSVRAPALGAGLRWEPSRGGALFPHLHGPLPLSAVRSVVPLPRDESGRHVFPDAVLRPVRREPEADGWVPVKADNFIGLVGPIWRRPSDEVVPGERRYALLAGTRHLNNNGMMHGGMIMSFADHALGLTVRSVNTGNRQATVQLDTHFLSGVEDGDLLEATCRVVRETRSILFMAADLTVDERPVARVQGVWKLGAPLHRAHEPGTA